jgi:conjugative relaxase-like TrwC/TraI family protein
MISAGGAAGVGYYAGGGGDDTVRDASGRNYYTGASGLGERPGTWSGSLAAQLGLTGVVVERDMAVVYEEFVTPDGSQIGNGPRNFKSVEERMAAALAKEPNALPERVEAIRLEVQQASQSTCRGLDLTAGVPKSVTVAYVAAWRSAEEAISDGRMDDAAVQTAIRESLDGAILAANSAALDAVADLAVTRLGKHGAGYAGRWVETPNLVVASFPQLTSRADDPHFHVHNVLLNRGATEDGKIGALDTEDIKHQRHEFSAVFDRALAEELGAMGVQVEWKPGEREDGWRNWEIKGIDQEALDVYSQRRAQITKAMAPIVEEREARMGRELSALERQQLAQTINLVTRESKGKEDIDWTEKLGDWQNQITDRIGAGLGPIAAELRAMIEENAQGVVPTGSGWSPDAVVAQARYELAQKGAAWNRADAYLAIDQALPAQLGVSSEQARAITLGLVDALVASEGVEQVSGNSGALPPSVVQGSFTRPSSALYAAPETLEAENLIIRAAVERGVGPTADLGPRALEAWRDQVGALVAQHYPEMLPAQRAAVIGLASSDAAMAQLIGPAGTGKSFTSGALAHVWTEMTGGRVIGLATSQVAADVLKGDGVAQSFNLSAWQAMQGRVASGNARPDDVTLTDRDILLVDETSMAGSMPVRDAVAHARAAGARTIGAGDPQQLGAVGAGRGHGSARRPG